MLVDIGFIALSRGLDQHAITIFDGVRVERPDQEAGPIGIALVHLLHGDLEKAVDVLRKLGPSDAARTFLGIALARQGAVSEARNILTDVAKTTADAAFARLAQETLTSLNNTGGRA